MKIYMPQFMDCNDVKVMGKAIIKATNAAEALEILDNKMSDFHLASAIAPHQNCTLVGVKEIAFDADGFYLL